MRDRMIEGLFCNRNSFADEPQTCLIRPRRRPNKLQSGLTLWNADLAASFRPQRAPCKTGPWGHLPGAAGLAFSMVP